MNEAEIVQLCEEYLKKHVNGPEERKYVRKLLLGGENCFAFLLADLEGDIPGAIKRVVISAQGGKTEALRRMYNFYTYGLEPKGYKANIVWPEIADIGNRYERIIYMMRILQDTSDVRQNIVPYLSDKLWVNTRTVDDDLSYIIPPRDERAPRTFFQQSLVINGMKHRKGAVEFISTAHPIFLIENLESVLVLIESLLEKATHVPYQGQAMTTAKRIWRQLTDYARQKIQSKILETYPEGGVIIQLFTKMKETVDTEPEIEKRNEFVEESKPRENPIDTLMYAMKSGRQCKITYVEDEWELHCWSGVVKGNQFGYDELVLEDGKLNIPFEDIRGVDFAET